MKAQFTSCHYSVYRKSWFWYVQYGDQVRSGHVETKERAVEKIESNLQQMKLKLI
jgi:hypothetical protein